MTVFRSENTFVIRFMMIFFFCCCFFYSLSYAKEKEEYLEEILLQGITLELCQPEYSNGVLKTSKGGIITGRNIRIQAVNITFQKQKNLEGISYDVIAEDSLMLQIGCHVFLGSRLEYNFTTNTGVLYHGRGSMEPWFFGGEKIVIDNNGSYTVINGYLTTSESIQPEWYISCKHGSFFKNQDVVLQNLTFRFFNLPLFWLPKLQTNLNSVYDVPIRYTVHWGGGQGPRIGMIYEVFSWNRFKTLLRLDWRLKRGLGGGFETHYKSLDHKTQLHTINYVAYDRFPASPHKNRTRYRMQGVYQTIMSDDSLSVNLTYDKLSDRDMATDYQEERELELEKAKRTKLHIRKQSNNWIANFYTTPRINSFQTLKQELPSIDINIKPKVIAHTGIISATQFSASYLDFVYSNDLKCVKGYNSTRLEGHQSFYRPLSFGPFTSMPKVEGLAIFYGNNPEKNNRWLIMALFDWRMQLNLWRIFGNKKHVIEPYLDYRYYSCPTINPCDHYIFDINDGWFKVNLLRYGLEQNVYFRDDNGCIDRSVRADIYTYSFFDTNTVKQSIPRIYADVSINTSARLRHFLNMAWDFERGMIDHFNLRMEWTSSENLAIAIEYRQRSSFCWRKVDPDNFILDFFHTEEQLRHSLVSDRRDTLLIHGFWRFHPCWAFEIESRQGWKRLTEPRFFEYDVSIHSWIRSTWRFKLSYKHTEYDDRFAVYFTMGLLRPEKSKCSPIPCIAW